MALAVVVLVVGIERAGLWPASFHTCPWGSSRQGAGSKRGVGAGRGGAVLRQAGGRPAVPARDLALAMALAVVVLVVGIERAGLWPASFHTR
jgi:hypothetical protein